ncbi:restriction endonuclease [Comamonas odontotermitis]|uniref:restriction endonuclease n=1 Tax=Comamonas odontotermitis TaxID=379895 RepID=UPI003751EF54
MARRRKSSAAEDLLDLVAMLPWWASVVLALVSYWSLHAIAIRPLPVLAPSAPKVGDLAYAAIVQGLASSGQYILPVICLAGALISAIRRRRRSAVYNAVSANDSADALRGMTWQEFEMLVGEGFRRRGYQVKELGGGGPDGGVDLVLTKSGEKFLVQCKQWKAFKVGVSTVRELYGVMAADGAAGGFVVTSGQFTKEAVTFANGRNIRLLDGSALMQLLRKVRSEPSGGRLTSKQPPTEPQVNAAPTAAEASPIPVVTSTIPSCPTCGKGMVRRVAKRGPAAGKAFWGCSAFSEGCRGTLEMSGWQG